MALISCPSCGKQISDKAEKCPHCGKELLLIISNTAVKRKCEECGIELEPDTKICPNCGCPVEERHSSTNSNVSSCNVENNDSITSPNDAICETETPNESSVEKKPQLNDSYKTETSLKPGNKASSKKKIGIITALSIAIVVVAVYFGTSKMRAYSSAQKQMESGDYESAVFTLESIQGYKDADSLREESWYKVAEKYAANEEYAKALDALANIPDNKEAQVYAITCKYEQAKQFMETKEYKSAHDIFSEIIDYENASELDKKCLHMIDVQNDKKAPSISGLEEPIEVQCGTVFNVKDFISEHISIIDDVTEEITDFEVECESNLYDRGSGTIDTSKKGSLEFIVKAKDEAGNQGKTNMLLSLKPVHVTREDPHPLVYDGDYATISVKSFEHGEFYGQQEYRIVFEIKNKLSDELSVYLPYTTSINDYQVGAYYTLTSIAPEKTGTMESHIYDEDISDSIGDYNQIDSEVCLLRSNEEKSFYSIPIIFDTNAIG